ncbi:MAG: DNA cytosine methyltransferase [Lactococcus lactis]|nr:DNA cytosine methyltransferase [Lactococcus lactis]
MKKEINILELFSGIGGFSKGFEDAGFEIKNHYFSEIDKHAIANYKHNFPNAKFIGSVVDISGRDFTECLNQWIFQIKNKKS